MTQTIDPIKLKAAAEHLEWVLMQYPDEPAVQNLLRGLLPLIENAKAGRVMEPVDRIPFAYTFADGRYIPYDNPSVDEAYYDFAAAMRGGRTEEEKQLTIHLEAMRKKFEGSQP
jgi:hypothetical protein